jgi:transposase
VPKLLCARQPEDAEEQRKIHKLAASRHAPGDWILRARIISLSWHGLRTAIIAEELGCHPKTVRTRLHRFNAESIDGLGDRPRAGRKPRITEVERSRIIALVCRNPPGKLLTEPGGGLGAEDEKGAAYWTLDALAEAAQQMGIEVRRSQVRRILLREGVRWRNTRPWAESTDPEFVPKGPESSSFTPTRRLAPRWSASTSLVPLPLGSSLRLRGGHRTDTASRHRSNIAEARTRRGYSALSGWRMASHLRSPRVRGTQRAT